MNLPSPFYLPEINMLELFVPSVIIIVYCVHAGGVVALEASINVEEFIRISCLRRHLLRWHAKFDNNIIINLMGRVKPA